MFKSLVAASQRGLAVCALSALATVAMHASAKASLYDDAKKEGKVVWYVAQFDLDTAEKIASAFKAKYPGVGMDVVRASTGVILQRVLQEASANVFAADVFSTTDEGHGSALKMKGMLECYLPPDAANIVPDLRGPDPDNCYQVTSTWLILMTYNTKSVNPGNAPKDWTDLLDPKWKNQIAIGHPAYSGSVATWMYSVQKQLGWSYFEKLEKQSPRVGRSINETVTVLNSGERQVAVGLDVTTLKSKAAGNPIDVIYPTSGSVLMLAPSAVLKKAPHPNAAKLFLNFMLSKEYSEVLVANSFHPIRIDVPPVAGAKPLREIKTTRPPLSEIESGNLKVIKKFRETFGN
jgi:iron(III) transport system substrate-binding protein